MIRLMWRFAFEAKVEIRLPKTLKPRSQLELHHMRPGGLRTTLFFRNHALEASLARVLSAEAGEGSAGAALVIEAAGGLAGLAEEVAAAVADFAARDDARAIVFVASSGGVGWDALQGLTRGYAAAWAPGVRVNAIAPARADDMLDAGQAAAALLYLLKAEAVTGQTVFTGPR
jgi:hypothetical protein